LINRIRELNKNNGGEFMAYECGEKPGIGRYQCINCGKILRLDDATDVLPPCSKCKKCLFNRV
jgi:hypothetical protein